MSRKKKCKLCSVKRKTWEGKKFFGVSCKYKFIPMVILKEHKSEITEEEYEELIYLTQKYHPRLKPNLKDISNIDDHWFVYLTRK